MIRLSSAILLLLGTVMVLAQNKDLTQIKERELEAVREKISDLKTSMDRRAIERDLITGELQAAEVVISEQRIRLKDLERQRSFSEKKKANLDAQLEIKMADMQVETKQLEAQVIAAYTSGEQERMKLLLNQHDPATLGRLMTYYRYMSEFRGANIFSLNQHIDELAGLREEVSAEEARLAGLTRARYAELTDLNAAQEKRQGLLVALKSRISAEGSEIRRLAAEEEDLARLIVELTSILSDYPITSEEPFSKLKGVLTWPVSGGLLYDFGQPRAGGLKWNGVVLTAPRGREVRSIYHGRVVFSDWLAGM
ncbi:MAG: murein hydrolase activator EnvC family protein, partial [Woeseiales bacterium]